MTEAGKVYSSNNEGASFTLINPNLRGADGYIPVLRVIYQPDYKSGHAKSEYIILQGCLAEVDTNGFERCTSKYHWASKDLGETWIQPCGLEDSGADCFKSPTTEAGGSIETTFRMDPLRPRAPAGQALPEGVRGPGLDDLRRHVRTRPVLQR